MVLISLQLRGKRVRAQSVETMKHSLAKQQNHGGLGMAVAHSMALGHYVSKQVSNVIIAIAHHLLHLTSCTRCICRFIRKVQDLSHPFLLGCLVLLLTVACNGNVAQPPSDEAALDTNASPATHRIDHALGSSEVPLHPQRVIVMNPAVDLDNLLALGIKPIGVARFTGDRPFAVSPYLEEQAKGIEIVGDLVQPNLEKLLQLDPDLILMDESQRRLYRLLSEIAPTVGLSMRVSQWQDRFLALAAAVNQSDHAEQLLDEYNQHVEAFQDMMGDRLSEIDVSYIRVRPDGIFLYVKSSLVGGVMDDLGIKRPPAQDVFLTNSPRIPISLEELEKADGDVMFIFGVEFGDTDETFAQLQTHPLWQQLDAVKADQVHVVTEAYWSFPGIQGVHLLIDDLAQYLGGIKQSW